MRGAAGRAARAAVAPVLVALGLVALGVAGLGSALPGCASGPGEPNAASATPGPSPAPPASRPPAAAGRATLTGTITSPLPPPPGPPGDLHVMLFSAPHATPEPPVASRVEPGVPFGEFAAGRAYALPGIPVRDEPYRLIVIYDSNRNGLRGGPDPGDVMTSDELFVRIDGPRATLDLPLDEVVRD